MFVFNSDTRQFEKTIVLPEGRPLDLGLQIGPDGYVYGFTQSCLYRLDTRSFEIEEIFKSSDEFDVAGPILGKDVYYAKGWFLKALPLFK